LEFEALYPLRLNGLPLFTAVACTSLLLQEQLDVASVMVRTRFPSPDGPADGLGPVDIDGPVDEDVPALIDDVAASTRDEGEYEEAGTRRTELAEVLKVFEIEAGDESGVGIVVLNSVSTTPLITVVLVP
jgi:hypothetical protein